MNGFKIESDIIMWVFPIMQRLRKSVSMRAMLIGRCVISWKFSVLHATFERLYEEFMVKYPKYVNIFQPKWIFLENSESFHNK